MYIRKKAALVVAGTAAMIGIGLAPLTTAPAAAQSSAPAPALHRTTLALASVKRSTVMDRAWFWENRNVQYSQTSYYPGPGGKKTYRQDCSGFISMSWMLPTSATTWTLGDYATVIKDRSGMRRGDALTWPHHHAVLFQKWANTSKTEMWILEEANPEQDMNYRKVARSSYAGYTALRRHNIVNG